jgi:hypothetical protein
MARVVLKGIASLIVITAAVFVVLRGLHLAVPIVFPETRQGPIAVERLEDVRRQVGFAPILPAYRPAILGDHPGDMTIQFSPVPTFRTVWRGDAHDLTLTQRRGGPDPVIPPLASPLEGVPNAMWWVAGGRSYLMLRRDEFWIALDTSLPSRELRRFADTLTTY